MDELIPVLSRLNDVFSSVGQAPVILPTIVVVGSQSSGKSSVLESFVGRDFLPRGRGIVTRCPLILTLRHIVRRGDRGRDEEGRGSTAGAGRSVSPGAEREGSTAGGGAAAAAGGGGGDSGVRAADDVAGDEWGEFSHKAGQKFYDFDEIRQEIIRRTEALAGTNKGITSEEIHLTIHSPNVVDLTLTDLPGLTNNAVGEQPSDIAVRIRRLVYKYISHPERIILAATEATQDIANSEALAVAREVDPDSVRTVGVLTKLDLMDAGTDAYDVLMGRVIALARGFVGVVNRSQRDISDGVTMQEARLKEQRFFEGHATYRHIARRLGTRYLARTLSEMLMQKVRQHLPELKSAITSLLVRTRNEVAALGEPAQVQTRATQGHLLLSLVNKYCKQFQDFLDGNIDESPFAEDELTGGARIRHVFDELFTVAMREHELIDEVSEANLRMAVRNSNGTQKFLIVAEPAFQQITRQLIKRLESPGLECVDRVYDEMVRITTQCAPRELDRFGELRDEIVDRVNSLLRSALSPTHRMVQNLIHIQLSYINTRHPDFDFAAINTRVQEEEEEYRLEQMRAPGLPPSEPGMPDDPRGPQEEEDLKPGRYGDDDADYGDNDPAGGGGVGFGSPVQQLAFDGAARRSRGGGGTVVRGSGGPGALKGVFAMGMRNPDSLSAMRPAARSRVFMEVGPDGRKRQQLHLGHLQAKIGVHDQLPDRDENRSVRIIREMIRVYSGIVKKTVIDLVPKTIMCFLVNHVRDNIQSELVRCLYSEANFDRLLRETDETAVERRKHADTIEVLEQALSIVNEVREFHVMVA